MPLVEKKIQSNGNVPLSKLGFFSYPEKKRGGPNSSQTLTHCDSLSQLKALITDSQIIQQKQYEILKLDRPTSVFTFNLHDCAFFIVKKGKNVFVAHKDFLNTLEPLTHFLNANDDKAELLLLAGLEGLDAPNSHLHVYAKRNVEHLTEVFKTQGVIFDQNVMHLSKRFDSKYNSNILVKLTPLGGIDLIPIDYPYKVNLSDINNTGMGDYAHIFPYHPIEILPPAPEDLLPLRSKYLSYSLEPSLAKRLKLLAPLISLYERYNEKSYMIKADGKTEQQHFYLKHKESLDKVFKTFGQISGGKLFVSDIGIKRFNLLKKYYENAVITVFDSLDIPYSIEVNGFPIADDKKVNEKLEALTIQINPGADNNEAILELSKFRADKGQHLSASV
jgi:hypothetical protein